MLIYNIVTAICFAALTLCGGTVLVKYLLKSHQDRVEYVRGFKSGKVAIIYVIGIPLYFIGHLYAKNAPLDAFFTAVNKILATVVLQYDTATVADLMANNAFYNATVYYYFAMIGCNALLFTFSLVGRQIWLFFQGIKFRHAVQSRLIVVGDSHESRLLCKSAQESYTCMILDKISDDTGMELYGRKLFHANVDDVDAIAKSIFQWSKGSTPERPLCVAINTKDENKNVALCHRFVEILNGLSEKERENYFQTLKIYVFGDSRYAAIYEDAVSSAFGVLHYVDKYQKIAMDFIERYPLTLFMNERQIDYDTSLLKKDVEVNVFMVGFGKTNQQIFLTSVANNQFLTANESGGDPVLKQVNYVIFDKERADNNKNMNHNYYRFRNETVGASSDEYLPFPQVPANEIYYELDINDSAFYTTIRDRAMRNPNDANFVVIAFGSDLENIDMAQKLIEKRREWNLKNLVVFVKVRQWTKAQTLIEEDGCFFIGNVSNVIYNIEEVTGDKIYRMAHLRNEIYDVEYDITHGYVSEITQEYLQQKKIDSNKTWYTVKSQLERESNVYACLSLRSKLHLMGLDYCSMDDERPALTEREYLEYYAGKDQPDFAHYKMTANGKKVAYYTLEFKPSRRKNMAIHEHQRWNSFMISKGIVPATKEQILTEQVMKNGKLRFSNGKNYRLRRHGNLTTFDGLVDFRRMLAARDGSDELQEDVIKYDYQLLDDAYWILQQSNMKIVKK